MKEKKKLLNYCGLLGIAAFLSYTAAVVFSPLAYPGYNWMAQAVSDLSASMLPLFGCGTSSAVCIMYVRWCVP